MEIAIPLRIFFPSPTAYASVPLSDVEVRILGSLIEKESTTPDNYPLSLNALTNACNQVSNRDPVMNLTEMDVRNAVNSLRQQSFVRAIQPADSRVMKFQHLVTEKLNLDDRGRAVLCVLMLRGPQTAGEIRSRTGRLAEFGGIADVDATLLELTNRDLAVELPRRAGQKEVRYAHLLAGPPTIDDEDAVTAPAQAPAADRVATLEATVADLKEELADLRARFEEFQRQFS